MSTSPATIKPVPAAGWRSELDELRGMLPQPKVRKHANGLTVCVVENRRVPVVATAVIYGAGARDETPGRGGVAHFLEHMMFKGSERYGPGEIDHLTRALGGSNNAFTSHDSTVYYFTFASDRWRQAVDIEVDRMAGLLLDPAEVQSERQVILEEISMYEGEPWDALDREVTARLYDPHPYGRPVLGTRDDLAAVDETVLRSFHQRYYCPSNAVLVIAGDVEASVDELVEEAFAGLDGGAVERPAVARRSESLGLRRLERRQGEVSRMLLTLPAPSASDSDHPKLMLLSSILGSGRSSRLHRALVDEGQLCLWVSADIQESIDPGTLAVALEVVPGVEPARVEAEVLRQIERLRREGPSADEVARAQRMITADWVFGHEKVFQQAFLAGNALALFDLEHPWRYFEHLLSADAEGLSAAAEAYLRPEVGGVLGWSLAAD
ncbi:MAG: pitrilysin family protein [Acidobacteriota bacterium]